MEHFTPVSSALGGGLIGLSALILWLGVGRNAGISGIVGGALDGAGDAWRLAFIGGLMIAPALYAVSFGAPQVVVTAGPTVLIAAGLLVGFGTRLGSGCTSGHGVCGMARLSIRSMTATVTFMAAAAVTVFISRHMLPG